MTMRAFRAKGGYLISGHSRAMRSIAQSANCWSGIRPVLLRPQALKWTACQQCSSASAAQLHPMILSTWGSLPALAPQAQSLHSFSYARVQHPSVVDHQASRPLSLCPCDSANKKLVFSGVIPYTCCQFQHRRKHQVELQDSSRHYVSAQLWYRTSPRKK